MSEEGFFASNNKSKIIENCQCDVKWTMKSLQSKGNSSTRSEKSERQIIHEENFGITLLKRTWVKAGARWKEKAYPRRLKFDFHHQYFGSNKPINFSLASHKDMTFIMFSKYVIFNFKFHYSRYRLDRPLK